MIRLEVAQIGGHSVGGVTRQVLDELHTVLRYQCMDIIHGGDVAFDTADGISTFALDPPSAGTVAVELATGVDGSRAMAVTVHGIAAVTLAGPLRALAGQLQQQHPRLHVRVARTLAPPGHSGLRPAPGTGPIPHAR